MALFSALIKCFVPSSSSQVSDDARKADSSEKPKGKGKSKSSGAPIVLSYFPKSITVLETNFWDWEHGNM
ncbi:hypothetical protein CFP56_035791 [Quercus suber]|uniref:Uncharacterized protein n=1 Tax=Quercus suber TaxID=58331 RepID=A0AAW0LPN2_QUESU